jgi:hypothetical protein
MRTVKDYGARTGLRTIGRPRKKTAAGKRRYKKRKKNK